MSIKICNFCRKAYGEGVNGFCSEACELQSKKSKFTTMSVRHLTRNKLILLQNEILTSTNRKVPYSDLIDYIFDIAEKLLIDEELSERIIQDKKLFL